MENSSELTEREKLIVAKSRFFIRVILAALVQRNSEVAVDLVDYAGHYPDLKKLIDDVAKDIRNSKSKGPSGRPRQLKNKQNRQTRKVHPVGGEKETTGS